MMFAILSLAFVLPTLAEPPAAALAENLERIAREAQSYEAEAGISVRSLTRNAWVYRREGERLFVTASNAKVVTTAACLALLGPNYQFETRFFSPAAPVQGVLEKGLWIVGGGDPCLSGRFFEGNALAPFEAFAASLRQQGVTRIRGEIVLDDRFFDRELVPENWPKDQLSLDYCAPISALSFNEGCAEIEVQPRAPGQKPSFTISPVAWPWPISNEMETEPGRGSARMDFRYLADGVLHLRGSIRALSGSFRGKFTVPSPSEFFGAALHQALERKGIAVEGKARRVGENAPEAKTMLQLYVHRSPIQNALFLANKDSHNLHAEHLMKTLGAVVEDDGSWAGGIRAVRRYLRDAGIPDRGFALEDGSGLSRTSRCSPDLIASVLAQVYTSPHRDLYLKTLPVSGSEGKLAERLDELPYRGNVMAKTGWIQGASGLSGFAKSRSGEMFAFSILINYPGKTNNKVFKAIQDRICRELVDAPRAP